ncbi:hypothetical protein ACSBL2_00615 [Pedobacter sp. AW31-3R]|uniref:hypothetical protein n=1 Tax=Pedobacter sp. AW31-3R TaxID=3445781 RepID=UPI003FA0F48C
MKRIFLSAVCILFSLSSFAQSNFYKLSIGGGLGATQSFTEIKKHDFGLAGYGTLDYLFTPFVSLGFEAQMGEVNGGDFQNDPDNRQFVNTYKAVTVNGKVALGEILENDYSSLYNSIKGLYFGAGIGVIQNKMSAIARQIRNDPEKRYPGMNASKDILIPLNLGINFFFPDRQGFYRYVLNFNYQTNLTMGEGLDGYDDSILTYESGGLDIYTFFSVGLKYNFGKMGLYRKTFRGY